MRITTLHQMNARHFAIAPLVALALAVTSACGGEKDGDSPVAAPPPVTPVVSVGEASGTKESGVHVDYSNVSYETAESTYVQRRFADATAMFDAYVQRRPENPWGHYMLGLSAWKSGDLASARGAFERSLELDSTHVKTLLNLSRVLLDQDRAGEARERVLAAMALDSTSGEVHRMLGRTLTALGLPDEAIEAYRTALTVDPGEVWAMNNVALIYIQQERYEDALGPLARAVQLRPGAPVFQNNLGIALELSGHVGAAREAYRAAIFADSSYAKARVSLARVEGLEDDPAKVTVVLSVLADAFEREVQQWRDGRMAVVTPEIGVAVTPDPVPTPEP
ncbi:MAG TPA: tetratricopeptide repeat protein [Gemmatimonadaceae bacterium]|nr:tetratricopeptide repeat protein [Gemmatimonadaceae bacterium]